MSYKPSPRIDRNGGHKFQTNKDNLSWWFSDDIEDWIKAKNPVYQKVWRKKNEAILKRDI